MEASGWGRTATVQALIGAGADLNLQDKFGVTALMWASRKGHTATVQALIGAGADLNLQIKVSSDCC
jgi:ankyrin repeat protein